MNTSRILSLRVDNVKRISAVDITPSSDVVVVAGKNGQGKSSVLDSIVYALAGRGAMPSDPIRHGAHRAEIELDLGDMIVTRSITPSGTALVVKGRDGNAFKSPQAMLDALVGRLSFDPLAFSRQSPKEQGDTLRDILHVDTNALDEERAALFAERTNVSRETRNAAGAVAAAPKAPDGTPDKPVDVADVLAEISMHHNAIEAVRQHERDVSDMETQARRCKTRAEEFERQVIDLLPKVAEAKAEYERRMESARAMVAPPTPSSDLDALTTKLRSLGEINRAVAMIEAMRDLQAKHAHLAMEVVRLTNKIDSVAASKRDMLAAAACPIDGLALTDDGEVSFLGVPLNQASSAEQIKVGMAVGLLANPSLRVVLIRDGSLLDEDSMRVVADLAAAADAQVWVERVGDATVEGAMMVVIEDGSARVAE